MTRFEVYYCGVWMSSEWADTPEDAIAQHQAREGVGHYDGEYVAIESDRADAERPW